MTRMHQAVLAGLLGVALAACGSEHVPEKRSEGPPVSVKAETIRLA